MNLRSRITFAVACALGLGFAIVPGAQTPGPFNENLLRPFTYRNLGPFRMGARTSDIAVPASPAKDHLYTFYVSFWTGGVWKTTNNGTTFEPIFDQQSKLAVGDVTVAPSNPSIVWVGTGDAFTSRSSYRGDGVYKSTDAGRTWRNMGLPDSHHISRIQIHPTNPDIVFVGAMGHLYSNNPERGVFKTTDGGQSWVKSLDLGDKVGVIDLVMDPSNPAVLYAAAYDKQRMPWQIVNGGPGSGIYKTTDGGAKWTKLAGGLPTGKIGRIGLDIYLKNPSILYAVIEDENPRPGAPPNANGSTATMGGSVYRTADAGQTWTKMNADDYNVSPKGPYYFNQIRVDPNNDQQLFVTQDGYRHSMDGGRTWNQDTFPRMFGDFRTLWIDPENSQRMISGGDGGIAISYDGGRTSDAYANIPVGEIYGIGVDNEDPYNLYAGLQDHEQWKGPSEGPLGRVTVWDWMAVGDNDGIMTQVDPTDSRWLYTTRQYGGHTRVDQLQGYETNIWPRREPEKGDPYRFQWITPISISPHDPKVIYAGAQFLLRSPDRGDHWTEMSPDLSTNDKSRILPESEGGVPGGIPWFAITSIAESTMTRGLIWCGTSDGKVQLTRNDGGAWTDVTKQITAAGAREDGYVSRVRASSHVAGRAYVAKNGYRFDDFKPYLYTTDDYGATWKSISSNLPNEPINVVWEDVKNPNLLFVGNDTGAFVSIDRGAHWVKLNNNMPNIPVHDLVVHSRENDLILGTYGRDFWITNVGALQELTDAVLAEDAHLFSIKPTTQRVTWSFGANDYLFGQRHLSQNNEPNGMLIRYYLKAPMTGLSIVIADASGKEVARLVQGAGGGGGRAGGGGRGGFGGGVTGNAGINTFVWDTRITTQGGGAGTAARGQATRGGANLESLAPLGDYTVSLVMGTKTLTQKAKIAKTQGWALGLTPTVIR